MYNIILYSSTVPYSALVACILQTPIPIARMYIAKRGVLVQTKECVSHKELTLTSPFTLNEALKVKERLSIFTNYSKTVIIRIDPIDVTTLRLNKIGINTKDYYNE